MLHLAGFEGPTSKGGEGKEKGGERGRDGEGRGGEGRGEGKEKRGERGGRRREGRRGLSGNVAEEAFCLKSAPGAASVRPSVCASVSHTPVLCITVWYSRV